MTPNQILQRWFEEVWNQGRKQSIDELLAPGAQVLGLPGGTLRGPAEYHHFHDQMNEIFCDFDIRVNDSVEWYEQAMVRFSLIMTYEATGHRAALEAACWVRCEKGQMIEAHNYIDFLALLQQLSLAPADFFQRKIAGTD